VKKTNKPAPVKLTLPAPGVYKLTKDIANTKRDRRQTRDWRHEETWKAGWLLVVEARPHGREEERHCAQLVRFGNQYGGFVLHSCEPDEDLHPDVPALLAALEPAPLTVETYFSGANGDPSENRALEIVQKLVDARVLSFADLRRAWHEVEQDDEREGERWRAKNEVREAARAEALPRFFCRATHGATHGAWTCTRVKGHDGKCHTNGIGDADGAREAAWAGVKAAEDEALAKHAATKEG
jgi:hypothetical protein